MLDDQQFLGDLGLPSQVAMLQLAVQTVPKDAEISQARELMLESLAVIDLLDEFSIRELEVNSRPPLAVEIVCLSIVHLLAGLSAKIETKANGVPKDPSWSTCQAMLRDPKFIDHLRQLPAHIASGKLSENNWRASGQRFSLLQRFVDTQMELDWRCESSAGKALSTWLTIVRKFRKAVKSIEERLADELGSTSLFDVIVNAPALPASR